jgi:hypothetical protein
MASEKVPGGRKSPPWGDAVLKHAVKGHHDT